MNTFETKAVEHFQAILRKKTVSNSDDPVYKKEFKAFLPLLKKLYPAVFSAVECQLINEFGILIHWKGKDSSLNPVVLMAHHDVVSDEGQQWLHPAFDAEIHDGYIWARGSVDNKEIFTAIFEAMELLIKDGFVPSRDVYFASSNCEEVAGDTMKHIVKWFRQNNITPEFVLDEGGAIMLDLPLGIKTPCAMIGVSEKGWGTFTLTATGKSGHYARISNKDNATVKIAKAVEKISKNPMPAVLNSAVEGMLENLAPFVEGPVGTALKNVKLLKPAVKKVMESIPDTAAMISSKFTVTEIKAESEKPGTVPATATATLKMRVAPHDNINNITEHINKTVGDLATVTVENFVAAPAISSHKTDSFAYIEKTIKKVFPDVGVAPFILDAMTDSRDFAPICKEVYRFGAFRINNEQFDSVHNANERMEIDVFLKSIEFYKEFILGI